MTRPLRRVPLALVCLALCAALLSACGGNDEAGAGAGAKQILQQTFGTSASAIKSGRLDVDLRLDPEGLLALGGPIRLTLDGPFGARRASNLPRFDVDFVATLAHQSFKGNALSTGRQAFVTLDDRAYRVDDAFAAKLRTGLGGSASGQKRQAGLRALGIDPLRWISGAQEKGNERVAGVDTIRIGGNVNVARLLEDLDTLLTKAGGAADGDTGNLLSPNLRKQIAGAADSAKVDIWTGASDKLLRQLAVAITFAFKDGSERPIAGLEAGTINLRLRLADVNATTVDVSAPKRARPLSTLTGGGLSNFLDGVGAALEGGSGGALLTCVTGANGRTVALVRCVSKLADQ